MKKFLIYTAKITILLVAVVLITLPLLGEERYVNLAFYLSIGCLVFLIGLDKKWVKIMVLILMIKEAGLSLLNQLFYILTFFYKYVFFPLLN